MREIDRRVSAFSARGVVVVGFFYLGELLLVLDEPLGVGYGQLDGEDYEDYED